MTRPSLCAARAWAPGGRCRRGSVPIAASSNASVTRATDAWSISRSVEATAGAMSASSAADAHAGQREHRRVGIDSISIRRRCGSRNLDRSVCLELDRFDPRRQRDGRLSVSFAERHGDALDQAAHPASRGEEDRGGRIGRVRAPIGPQPEQQRSRPCRDRRHLRRHRLGAQAIGLACVDAADQRIDEPVEHLSPEPALDERPERVRRHRPARQHRLDRRPRHPSHAEDPRTHHGPDLARHAERESAGQPAQRATRPHVCPGVRRRDERITEPDALRQRDRLGHPCEERVCRLVDRESRRTRTCGCSRRGDRPLRARSPRCRRPRARARTRGL